MYNHSFLEELHFIYYVHIGLKVYFVQETARDSILTVNADTGFKYLLRSLSRYPLHLVFLHGYLKEQQQTHSSANHVHEIFERTSPPTWVSMTPMKPGCAHPRCGRVLVLIITCDERNVANPGKARAGT